MTFVTTFPVRDGTFDVAILAGPRVPVWPSVGVRALSSLCAEMGLTVGAFGGAGLSVLGAIPLPGTGAVVLIEDSQRRIHRIRARAIVKVVLPPELPDPFPGWRSQGLVPLSAARRLMREAALSWKPAVAVLGVGNQALRFACELLESGRAQEAYCVSNSGPIAWEVERRRFEMLGGKTLNARPVNLTRKAALLWSFRVQDDVGIRVLDVARVISAGPFHLLDEHGVGMASRGFREDPPGSNLYEFELTSSDSRAFDAQGWDLEEERGRWLAGKIVKSLGDVARKDHFERVVKRARARARRFLRYRETPHSFEFEGKWIAAKSKRNMMGFEGVPQKSHQTRLVASIECFEDISCNLCEKSCPESAIQIERASTKAEGERGRFLVENDCTACGACLTACPSGTPVLVHEPVERSTARLVLPWRGSKAWEVGEFPVLVNRKGDPLGSGRVITGTAPAASGVQLVHLEVPSHLVWDARGLRASPRSSLADAEVLQTPGEDRPGEVEITYNGERRILSEGSTLGHALFENGMARPEDILACPDGSCRLCVISVDGVKKLACQTKVRKGMNVKASVTEASQALCPCLGVTSEQVIERIRQGKLKSPEAVISATGVGTGACHGQLCMGAFLRLITSEGIDARRWIDWRFPWRDWVLVPGAPRQSPVGSDS